MKIFKKRLNKKGFTLVELLIVIAVLGIIAGIGVSSMGNVTDTFKEKADLENVKMVARQIEIFYMSGDLKGTSANTDLTGSGSVGIEYPDPQQASGSFEFSVDASGNVIAIIKDGDTTTAITDALATDVLPTITIETDAVE